MEVVILRVLMAEGGLCLSLLAYQTASKVPPQQLLLQQLEDQSSVDWVNLEEATTLEKESS